MTDQLNINAAGFNQYEVEIHKLQDEIKRLKQEKDQAVIDAVSAARHRWAKAEQDLDGFVLVPVELIEAVAHIGVDFGFGEYELEEKHIKKARSICETLQAQK